VLKLYLQNIYRNDLPDNVVNLAQVLDEEFHPFALFNGLWTIKQDEQIMQWSSQRPQDWEIGGKCKVMVKDRNN